MTRKQGKDLDRKKFYADPVIVTTIVLLIVFLTLFILYPLAILLVDSFVTGEGITLNVFRRILAMHSFRKAITNTLKVGFLVGILLEGYTLLVDTEDTKFHYIAGLEFLACNGLQTFHVLFGSKDFTDTVCHGKGLRNGFSTEIFGGFLDAALLVGCGRPLKVRIALVAELLDTFNNF
jgi:hypothetical protein